MSDINYHERGCLTCRSPDCPVWQAADQNCWKSQADNDAQVAKKERERVLCELLAYIHPDSRAGCVIKEKLKELRGDP